MWTPLRFKVPRQRDKLSILHTVARSVGGLSELTVDIARFFGIFESHLDSQERPFELKTTYPVFSPRSPQIERCHRPGMLSKVLIAQGGWFCGLCLESGHRTLVIIWLVTPVETQCLFDCCSWRIFPVCTGVCAL